MRYVVKSEPECYSQFIKHNQMCDWDNDMPSDKKREVREYILKHEQHFYSAYTEKKLAPNVHGLHVDHFHKQAHFPNLMFEWSNLFVDKHEKIYGADYKDSRESPLRSQADYQRLIDPQAENPQRFFRYMTNGDICSRLEICDVDKDKAQFTIDVFNLKHTSLSEERKQLINIISYLKREGYSANEIKDCLISESSFPSVIEYFCDEAFDEL